MEMLEKLLDSSHKNSLQCNVVVCCFEDTHVATFVNVFHLFYPLLHPPLQNYTFLSFYAHPNSKTQKKTWEGEFTKGSSCGLALSKKILQKALIGMGTYTHTQHHIHTSHTQIEIGKMLGAACE